ncbi:MAG TPA: hypothetical protein VN762_10930, partial [Steroidobacteraceae bacterium]|nr:hypothetical protein [Steroidobacteraceae bacterium]
PAAHLFYGGDGYDGSWGLAGLLAHWGLRRGYDSTLDVREGQSIKNIMQASFPAFGQGSRNMHPAAIPVPR